MASQEPALLSWTAGRRRTPLVNPNGGLRPLKTSAADAAAFQAGRHRIVNGAAAQATSPINGPPPGSGRDNWSFRPAHRRAPGGASVNVKAQATAAPGAASLPATRPAHPTA